MATGRGRAALGAWCKAAGASGRTIAIKDWFAALDARARCLVSSPWDGSGRDNNRCLIDGARPGLGHHNPANRRRCQGGRSLGLALMRRSLRRQIHSAVFNRGNGLRACVDRGWRGFTGRLHDYRWRWRSRDDRRYRQCRCRSGRRCRRNGSGLRWRCMDRRSLCRCGMFRGPGRRVVFACSRGLCHDRRLHNNDNRTRGSGYPSGGLGNDRTNWRARSDGWRGRRYDNGWS